jgi:hypothetical protein
LSPAHEGVLFAMTTANLSPSSPHISWLFGESEAMEAAIQAMCGLDGKPRPLKGTFQTAQVVEVLPDRKRFLSTGSKRFDTFLSIAGRGFLKPGFFMPLKSWFKNPCMHEKSGLGVSPHY